jgi:hypothetical protein
MRVDYEGAGCPEQTDQYNEEFIGRAPFTNGYPMPEGTPPESISGTNPLGDPIVFSAYLVGQIAGSPTFRTNFNLDADRGFGYLCWDWIRDQNLQVQNRRGQSYHPPETPPEGRAPSYTTPIPPYAAGAWEYPAPTAAGQDPPPLYTDIAGHPTRTLKLEYPGRSCVEGTAGPGTTIAARAGKTLAPGAPGGGNPQ